MASGAKLFLSQHWLSEAHGGGLAHAPLAGGNYKKMGERVVSEVTLPGNHFNSSHGISMQQTTMDTAPSRGALQSHGKMSPPMDCSGTLDCANRLLSTGSRPWEETGGIKITESQALGFFWPVLFGFCTSGVLVSFLPLLYPAFALTCPPSSRFLGWTLADSKPSITCPASLCS